MTESLWRHGTPELRPGDIQGLGTAAAREALPLDFADVMRGYFPDRHGARVSYHFWGYSALALPVRALLRPFGISVLHAPAVVNAIALAGALWAVLAARTLGRGERGAFAALLLFSPALGLLLWPHPEVCTFSLVAVALVALAEGKPIPALLAASLASTQNPPLVFLVGGVWCVLSTRAARSGAFPPARFALALLATAPAVVPALFFYLHFGTPSVIARQGAAVGQVSARKVAELFVDPNLGLLPYLPLPLAAFGLGLVRRAVRRTWGPDVFAALVLAPMAVACTATTNWNHGTSGPSRYALWMVPLVYLGLLGWRPRALAPARSRTAYAALLGVAVASQAVVVVARKGPFADPDYLRHSYAARLLLRCCPAAYDPTPEIFASRTLHAPIAAVSTLEQPVVYRDESGCRKAWARPADLPALTAACGKEPRAGGGRRGEWTYLDF